MAGSRRAARPRPCCAIRRGSCPAVGPTPASGCFKAELERLGKRSARVVHGAPALRQHVQAVYEQNLPNRLRDDLVGDVLAKADMRPEAHVQIEVPRAGLKI